MTDIPFDVGIDTNQRNDVSKKWIVSFGLLNLGTCISWAAPSQLLLANQIQILDSANKLALLGLLMTIGGAVQVVASLISGTLSDHTKSRVGKRLPWIVIGSVGASAALFAISFTPAYWVMVAIWGTFQFFTALATNITLTLIPDSVPQRQYGLISGIYGATYTLGLVLGTVIATALPLQQAYFAVVALYLAITAFYTFGGTWKVGNEVDAAESAQRAEAARAANRALERTKFHFADYKNYAWVFAARFVVYLGNYVALFFLFYYLRDHIGMKKTDPIDADTGVLILTVVYALATIASSIIGGKWSDRLGRRKVFVVASATLAGVAALMMSTVHTFPLVVIAGVILGIAWGVFTCVDQAIVNEALPHPESHARDMSIMTLTVGITNMMAGVTANFAVSAFGGYPGMYIVTGIVTILGAFLVLPVKSSR